jgi:hypothetical protein
MSSSKYLESLAMKIRDHDLTGARRQLRWLQKQNETRRGMMSTAQAIQLQTLAAALEIKRGRAVMAAAIFTRLLHRHSHLAVDPVFVANLGALFVLLGDESRARLTLACVDANDCSRPSTVFDDQARVWLDTVMCSFPPPSAIAEPEPKAATLLAQKKPHAADAGGGAGGFRSREADAIVWLKKSLFDCATLLKTKRNEQGDGERHAIMRRLQRALEIVQSDEELLKSKAVARLKREITRVMCAASVVRNGRDP